MMDIPLYILLFIYIFFLAFFTVFALINLYHIVMTASLTMTSFFMSFLIFAGSILIVYATWYFLQNIDWQQIMITIPSPNDFFSINTSY